MSNWPRPTLLEPRSGGGRWHSAPINSGQLFDDEGVLANTPAAGQILRDEYEYPSDVDPATKSLLQEASKIFKATAEDGVSTFVTSKDYYDWWLTADEDISLPTLAFILGPTRLRRTTNISLASRWRS